MAGAFSARGEEWKINNSKVVDINSLRWQVPEFLHYSHGACEAAEVRGKVGQLRKGTQRWDGRQGAGGVHHSGGGGPILLLKILK